MHPVFHVDANYPHRHPCRKSDGTKCDISTGKYKEHWVPSKQSTQGKRYLRHAWCKFPLNTVITAGLQIHTRCLSCPHCRRGAIVWDWLKWRRCELTAINYSARLAWADRLASAQMKLIRSLYLNTSIFFYSYLLPHFPLFKQIALYYSIIGQGHGNW